MDRASGQSQVNLSLLRSISVQLDLRLDLYKRTKNFASGFIADEAQAELRCLNFIFHQYRIFHSSFYVSGLKIYTLQRITLQSTFKFMCSL
jgi:hypothetical protein